MDIQSGLRSANGLLLFCGLTSGRCVARRHAQRDSRPPPVDRRAFTGAVKRCCKAAPDDPFAETWISAPPKPKRHQSRPAMGLVLFRAAPAQLTDTAFRGAPPFECVGPDSGSEYDSPAQPSCTPSARSTGRSLQNVDRTPVRRRIKKFLAPFAVCRVRMRSVRWK